jgi:hypothetical protein
MAAKNILRVQIKTKFINILGYRSQLCCYFLFLAEIDPLFFDKLLGVFKLCTRTSML